MFCNLFSFTFLLQVVPFCGVFLKELSDALNSTASIISLKQSPDNTDDSIEVQPTVSCVDIFQ